MVGQTNLFDDVIKSDERFVIVIQSLEERNEQLLERILREYPSLTYDQMGNLFIYLKDVFQSEPFRDNQPAYIVTVYTNSDYAAGQIYTRVKENKGKRNRTYIAR